MFLSNTLYYILNYKMVLNIHSTELIFRDIKVIKTFLYGCFVIWSWSLQNDISSLILPVLTITKVFTKL